MTVSLGKFPNSNFVGNSEIFLASIRHFIIMTILALAVESRVSANVSLAVSWMY
jgi:hypothetical protein